MNRPKTLTFQATISVEVIVRGDDTERTIGDVISDIGYEFTPPGECVLVRTEWRDTNYVHVKPIPDTDEKEKE